MGTLRKVLEIGPLLPKKTTNFAIPNNAIGPIILDTDHKSTMM